VPDICVGTVKPMILLHLAAVAAYALAAFAMWPVAVAPTGAASWAAPPSIRRFAPGLLVLALILHGIAVANDIVSPDGLDLSIANAFSLVAGLAAGLAAISGLLTTLPVTVPIVLPVAAVAVLTPLFVDSPHRFAFSGAPWAAAHVAVALVAYSLFLVAALQALVLMGLERRLHRRVPDPEAAALPSLLTLERYMFRLVIAGFVLLTVTLVSGALFSEQVFGRPVTLTHKNIFSVAGWLTFAVLLWGRWRYGWRGRRALRWIVAGTALLFLAYLGYKFVLEVLLGR
jgi:ABC-type uncharacterized transport system permease subunit